MPPKKNNKRKQQTQAQNHATNKKKKEDEQPQPSTPTKISKDNNTSDDGDDICVISPPPHLTKAVAAETSASVMIISTVPRTRKGKSLHSDLENTVLALKSKMLPISVKNQEFDLSKFQDPLKKLGLWEIANLDMDGVSPNVEELSQFVAFYSKGIHTTQVAACRMRVGRVDLAKTLGISSKREKNSVAMPEFEGEPQYALERCDDETVRACLGVIFSRVLPTEDPNVGFEEMVGVVKEGLESGAYVDWASLVWSRAEKELLLGKDLEKFYYASHFQNFINRRLQISRNNTDKETGSDCQDDNLKGKSENLKMKSVSDLNDIAHKEEDEEKSGHEGSIEAKCENDETTEKESRVLETLRPCSNKAVSVPDQEGKQDMVQNEDREGKEDNVDVGFTIDVAMEDCEQKVVDMQGCEQKVADLQDCDQKVADVEDCGQEAADIEKAVSLKPEKQNVSDGIQDSVMVDGMTSSLPGQQEMELEKNMLMNTEGIINTEGIHTQELEVFMSMNMPSDLQRVSSLDRQILSDKGVQQNADFHPDFSQPCFAIRDEHLRSKKNYRSQDELEDDDGHGMAAQEQVRSDGSLSFDFCMTIMQQHMEQWSKRARDAHEHDKEALVANLRMEVQHLSEELQHREHLLQNFQICKRQEEQQMQLEYSQLKYSMNLTSKIFLSYQKAVQESQKTIDGYRESLLERDKLVEKLNMDLQNLQRENEDLKQQLRPETSAPDNMSPAKEQDGEEIIPNYIDCQIPKEQKNDQDDSKLDSDNILEPNPEEQSLEVKEHGVKQMEQDSEQKVHSVEAMEEDKEEKCQKEGDGEHAVQVMEPKAEDGNKEAHVKEQKEDSQEQEEEGGEQKEEGGEKKDENVEKKGQVVEMEGQGIGQNNQVMEEKVEVEMERGQDIEKKSQVMEEKVEDADGSNDHLLKTNASKSDNIENVDLSECVPKIATSEPIDISQDDKVIEVVAPVETSAA